MKFSKQAVLGTGVLLGGTLLLYATIHQVTSNGASHTSGESSAQVVDVNTDSDTSAITNTPLTADIQTEKTILQQKQKEREARVEQQEQAAQQYLTEQQRIEAQALARSRAENQLYSQPASEADGQDSLVAVDAVPVTRPVVTPRATVKENTPATSSQSAIDKEEVQANSQNTVVAPTVKKIEQKVTVQKTNSQPKSADDTTDSAKNKITVNKTIGQPATTKPVELKAEAKKTEKIESAPSTYQVKRGDGLISLSKRYNIPVSAIAAANNIERHAPLRVGQQLKLPSANEVQRLQQQAIQQEQQRQQEIARKKQEQLDKQREKQDYQAAQQKLKQARQVVKETDAKGSFGVQVALAADATKAQEIAKKLQAAGYNVKTSQTSRGVRVVVGPETGKVAALALKDKVNSDPRLGMSNAWVLYW